MELQQLEDAEILPGDVVFFCADDWVGEVIAGVTGSEFCHVALAFDDCDEQTLFIECQGGTPKRVVDKGFYAGRQVAVLCGPHWFEIRHKAVEGLGRAGPASRLAVGNPCRWAYLLNLCGASAGGV